MTFFYNSIVIADVSALTGLHRVPDKPHHYFSHDVIHINR